MAGQAPHSARPVPFFHRVHLFQASGVANWVEHKRPQYDVGNAQYFPEGLARGWQLRPLVASDLLSGVSLPSGTGLLIWHRPGQEGGNLYFAMRVPYSHRKNTRSNVQRALASLVRAQPSVAELIQDLEDSTGPNEGAARS